MNESHISNLKRDCLNYMRHRDMSIELAEKIQALKNQVPNLSNYEAIELILDHEENMRTENVDDLSIWKVLKSAVLRRMG